MNTRKVALQNVNNNMAESGKKFEWKEDQLRKYPFPTDPIPRLSYHEEKASQRIANGVYIL